MRGAAALLPLVLATLSCDSNMQLIRHYRDLAAADCRRIFDCCSAAQRERLKDRYSSRDSCEQARLERIYDGLYLSNARAVETGEKTLYRRHRELWRHAGL
jgi:hypothetical protein